MKNAANVATKSLIWLIRRLVQILPSSNVAAGRQKGDPTEADVTVFDCCGGGGGGSIQVGPLPAPSALHFLPGGNLSHPLLARFPPRVQVLPGGGELCEIARLGHTLNKQDAPRRGIK